MIQPSSLAAYDSIAGTLGERQRAVYEVICDKPGSCNKEIWKRLGWEGVNCVTGRVKELREYGLVKPFGEYRYCSHSKKMTLHWYPECVFHIKPSILKNPLPKNPPELDRPLIQRVGTGVPTAADYKRQLLLEVA